jgi:hypothetical protein
MIMDSLSRWLHRLDLLHEHNIPLIDVLACIDLACRNKRGEFLRFAQVGAFTRAGRRARRRAVASAVEDDGQASF